MSVSDPPQIGDFSASEYIYIYYININSNQYQRQYENQNQSIYIYQGISCETNIIANSNIDINTNINIHIDNQYHAVPKYNDKFVLYISIISKLISCLQTNDYRFAAHNIGYRHSVSQQRATGRRPSIETAAFRRERAYLQQSQQSQ